MIKGFFKFVIAVLVIMAAVHYLTSDFAEGAAGAFFSCLVGVLAVGSLVMILLMRRLLK